jgi:hypothetical protein
MTIHALHSATHTDPVTAARVHLAAALRMAVLHERDEGIDNHFTVELSGRSGQYLILPFGRPWSEARACDLMCSTKAGAREPDRAMAATPASTPSPGGIEPTPAVVLVH